MERRLNFVIKFRSMKSLAPPPASYSTSVQVFLILRLVFIKIILRANTSNNNDQIDGCQVMA